MVTDKPAAASALEVFLPVAAAVADLLVAAPVAADQQVPQAVLAMTKELAAVVLVAHPLPEV